MFAFCDICLFSFSSGYPLFSVSVSVFFLLFSVFSASWSLQGPCVAGISEIDTVSVEEVMNLLQRGNRNRTQEPTAANRESSRSHAVLQIRVEQRDRAEGRISQVKTGKLSLIDLAGSERASSTKNRGLRLIEGANINRSLLALGNCINALGNNKVRNSHAH